MNIALNYGGREEIVNAVKNVCKDVTDGRQNVDDIDDEVFQAICIPKINLTLTCLSEQAVSEIVKLYALAGKLC